MRVGSTVAVAIVLFGCGGGAQTEAVSVTILAVEPADGVLLPEIPSASILFSATQSGQFRIVSSDLPGNDQLLSDPDSYVVGTLRSAQVGRAGLSLGGHLVSVVLAPADGSAEARASLRLTVFETQNDGGSDDGGSQPDAGLGGCDHCASEPQQPVCGVDGRTYDNECQLGCESPGVAMAFHDTCERCLNCPGKGVFPSCGEDRCVYMNDCVRECAGVADSNDQFHCIPPC